MIPTIPNRYWMTHLPSVWSHYLKVLEGLRNQHGDKIRTNLPKKTLWVFHPSDVSEVLGQSKASSFQKGENVRTFAPLLGDGIIASEGERWRKQRRTIAPEFHAHKVREFVPLLVDITERHFETLKGKDEILLHSTLCEWGLGTASQLFFGSTLPFKADDINRLFNRGAKALFIQGILRLKGKAADWVPYASEMKSSIKIINTWVYALIQQRRQTEAENACPFSRAIGPKNTSVNKDILSRILEGSDDQEIRDQCVNILMAGHDTTALTLFWTIHLLNQNPNCIRLLQSEIDDVFQGSLNADQIERLVYTEQVILESMRLFPVITSMSRQALEKVYIGDTEIQPGEVVQVIPWVTHRHPDFWEAPGEFRPERFESSKREQLVEGVFFPFGLGPRACVAQLLAITQMKIFLAHLIQNFEFSFAEKQMPRARPVLTLRTQYDTAMKIRPRAPVR